MDADLDEATALALYLSPDPIRIGSWQRWSSLEAALRDARRVTGRDEADGTFVNPAHALTWLGAVGYLAALDQLGNAVTVTDPDDEMAARLALHDKGPGKSFRRTLARFTDLPFGDICALYGLRCALVHSFGLANAHDDPNFRRVYELYPTGPLVVHPKTPWDGTYSVMGAEGCSTVVNVVALGGTVEAAVFAVRRLHRAGRIGLVVSAEELVVRFMFRFGTRPSA